MLNLKQLEKKGTEARRRHKAGVPRDLRDFWGPSVVVMQSDGKISFPAYADLAASSTFLLLWTLLSVTAFWLIKRRWAT